MPLHKKTMMFCSFGGRKYDDSPKAIYDEVCKREEFRDWRLIWAFVQPENYEIPRGEKIKIDTLSFFHALLYSRVWVSNSGMDRGLELHRKKNIIVETWHGTPLKKICGDEHQNSLGGSVVLSKRKLDKRTIRCAQSEYDRDIFARVFSADPGTILMSDLPRNDGLYGYCSEDIIRIKRKLHIDVEKKVIFYAPTYREYLINEHRNVYIKPPINLKLWKDQLGDRYVLLIRAHYAVSEAMNIIDDEFVKDVSSYPILNDLYIISDMMISDYSSTFFDYSILDRPMVCYAYDLEEYEEKRGLYLDLEYTLPCPVLSNEKSIIDYINMMDYKKASELTKIFHEKYAPYAGNASKKVVDAIEEKINE